MKDRTYTVHYKTPGPIFVYGPDGDLEERDELTVDVTAPNKAEARKRFNEIYYGLWHNDWNHRAMRITIEMKRKETT